ncbi:hypothetical protein BT69DRAFT_1302610 [Atractiella rhizophila]|nr:hypothetical protein BT69DRAFT_1302610 [Atractiella rhizophila]
MPIPMPGSPFGHPPGTPGLPMRPGLGAPGAAPNLPPPPNLNIPYAPGTPQGFVPPQVQPPQQNLAALIPPEQRFQLFVGSVVDGLSDGALEQILNIAGPVVTLKRIKDANGIPKPFGFVEYGDPETVLRCLEIVNGAEVKGPRGDTKTLMVKADDKVRARLDTYASSRPSGDEQTEALASIRSNLSHLLSVLDPVATSSTPGLHMQPRPLRVDMHLADLGPDDLPEESRGMITREIAFFRERAAKREAEKRAEKQGVRASDPVPQRVREPSRPDTGEKTESGEDAGRARENSVPTGPGRGWGARGAALRKGSPDREREGAGEKNNMGFVPAKRGQDENISTTKPTDEDEERRRLDRRRRELEMAFRDRERRWENRERSRANAQDRDRKRETMMADQEDRDRVSMRERLANFDDEREIEKGRETFYSDRARWRAIRGPFRQRERDMDAQDGELEIMQLEMLKKESEDFLNKQAEMFAKMSENKRKTGISLDDSTPIKLSLGVTMTRLKPTEGEQQRAREHRRVLGGDEDEEEAAQKKRQLVPINYSDEEDEEDEEEEEEKRIQKGQEQILEIVNMIPADKEGLWSWQMKWNMLDENIISNKLQPFARKKIVEYLGLEEEELVTAVVDHIRNRKSPGELVEEIEPVLEDESTEFVIKIWRMVIFESLTAEYGIQTST